MDNIEIQYTDGKYHIVERIEGGSRLLAICDTEKEAQEVYLIFSKRYDTTTH